MENAFAPCNSTEEGDGRPLGFYKNGGSQKRRMESTVELIEPHEIKKICNVKIEVRLHSFEISFIKFVLKYQNQDVFYRHCDVSVKRMLGYNSLFDM